ncbi:hypothetical protein R6Q59_012534, partial [Mikania micrantha]
VFMREVSNDKFGSGNLIMEGEKFQENKIGGFLKRLILLELAAANNVFAFKSEIQIYKMNLNDVGFLYGRKIWSKQMGFEEQTRLLPCGSSYYIESVRLLLNASTDPNLTTAMEKMVRVIDWFVVT